MRYKLVGVRVCKVTALLLWIYKDDGNMAAVRILLRGSAPCNAHNMNSQNIFHSFVLFYTIYNQCTLIHYYPYPTEMTLQVNGFWLGSRMGACGTTTLTKSFECCPVTVSQQFSYYYLTSRNIFLVVLYHFII